MSPENEEPTSMSEQFPDMFDEPKSYAMQWDVRELWPDPKPEPTEGEPPRLTESPGE